ncbi:hypothetical protein [Tsuneonella sp. HG222]
MDPVKVNEVMVEDVLNWSKFKRVPTSGVAVVLEMNSVVDELIGSQLSDRVERWMELQLGGLAAGIALVGSSDDAVADRQLMKRGIGQPAELAVARWPTNCRDELGSPLTKWGTGRAALSFLPVELHRG